MIPVRYFVLFLAINATLFVSVADRYVDANTPLEPSAVEMTDIFLPPEVKPIPVRTSWYGEKFHRKPTASGEKFNMNSVSVAHVSLPFGTNVRFLNPANDFLCDAVVNDSGPFDPELLPVLKPHPMRQFDASKALAECLGFVEEGVVDLYVSGVYNDRPLSYNEVHSDKIAQSNERFAKNASN